MHRTTRRSDVAEETIIEKSMNWKHCLMGDDGDMVKKAVYLCRTLEWGENGLMVRPIEDTCVRCCVSWEWRIGEVSPRHRVPQWRRKEFGSDRLEVSAELAAKHRAAVANGFGVLGSGSADLGVAAVELAKTMAIPREGDDERLERVARYLHGRPDYMQWYPVQEDTETVVLDHGCRLGHV